MSKPDCLGDLQPRQSIFTCPGDEDSACGDSEGDLDILGPKNNPRIMKEILKFQKQLCSYGDMGCYTLGAEWKISWSRLRLPIRITFFILAMTHDKRDKGNRMQIGNGRQ